LDAGRILAQSVRRKNQPTLPGVATVSVARTVVGVRVDRYRGRGRCHADDTSGVQPGDVREPAALLAIGPEAKARIRILVVDDEPHPARELRRSTPARRVRRHGLRRGQEALELLKRRAFDVLLVDLTCPQVDGLALLEPRSEPITTRS